MADVETSKEAPATAEVEAQNKPQEEAKPAVPEPEPEVETMRCIRLTGHGGYSKLKVEKLPKPKATDGHVVVKVHACGLNFADLMQRQGLYSEVRKIPFTPGFECSGVVEEIGEHVTEFEVGSRICCIVPLGAWAEYIAVPFTSCFVMPESMTFEEGAALPATYLTAYFMLFHCGNIRRRKSVLIHMAAGGVGTAATQLCKTVEGLTIFGTASASKHEMIKEFGVDHPIDYRTQDYAQAIKEITHGVDLILEPLSGSDTKKCYDLLNPMGVVICFGYANQISESKGMFSAARNWFQGVTFNPLKMMTDCKTICGFHLGRLMGSQELIRDAMNDLLKMYSDGALKPCIDSVFALEEVAKAQQKMHERKNIGKIILSPLKEPEPEPKKKKKSGSKLDAEQKPKGEAEEAKPGAKEGEKEEVPKQEEPKSEEPKPEEPKPEESKQEEPKQEEPKPEEPKPEEPKPEEPKQGEPKPEEPKPEEPKQGEPKPEEPKPDEPKQEEPKPEEPKPEKPKQEEPKQGESKQEEQGTTKEEPAQPKEEEKTAEQPAAVQEPAKEEPGEPAAVAAEPSSDEVKEETKEEEPKKEETAEPAPSTVSEAKEDEPNEQNTEM